MLALKWTVIAMLTVIYLHSSTGDREWTLETDYDRTDETYFHKTIFPSRKICRQEKEERIGETRKTRPRLWSNLINDYIFFSKELLSPDAQKFFGNIFLMDPNYLPVYFGVMILLLLIIVVGIGSIFIVFALGMFFFLVFFQIYRMIASARVRKCLRYLTIQTELARRRREDYLITASRVRKKPPKRRYHMVKFLRDHTDEEVPEELIENEEERLVKYKIMAHGTSSSDPDEEDDDDEDIMSSEKSPGDSEETPEDARRRLRLQKRRLTLKKGIESMYKKKLKTKRTASTLITTMDN